MKTAIKTTQQLEAELAGYIGSERIYHNPNGNKSSNYTEGARAYYQLVGAYWLEAIIGTQVYDILTKLDPDTYTLVISTKKEKAVITLNDYSGTDLLMVPISGTDHPEGIFKLVVGFDGERLITCLLSEN